MLLPVLPVLLAHHIAFRLLRSLLLQWAADDTDATKPGWYYSVTGGSTVGFSRSRDLKAWEPYHIAMSEEAGQFRVAEGLNGFAADAERKGWTKMALEENWDKWGYDNNDGDVCCADQAAAAKAGHGSSPFGWLVWGASTQGAPCGIQRADGQQTCSTNAVGRFVTNATSTLGGMLASFFK